MPRFEDFDFGLSWLTNSFHQDWIYDGDSAQEVVSNRLAGIEDESVAMVLQDALRLERLPGDIQGTLWDSCCDYLTEMHALGGAQKWTATVIDLCRDRLAGSSVELRGDDTHHGSELERAVVEAIEAHPTLDQPSKTALCECARECSPDLAFRLFLRAMISNGHCPAPRTQYEEWEVIGAGMRYGEFVVSTAAFLVED